jgi:hypothetical protein
MGLFVDETNCTNGTAVEGLSGIEPEVLRLLRRAQENNGYGARWVHHEEHASSDDWDPDEKGHLQVAFEGTIRFPAT